ncbi:hypothetical protein [Acinetobacter celticus]|uniref:Uncharacterized protein n=1 Tax=Acinetobacter celticus TaxID=1891224 RepID=A0A1C3CVT5_9GAMM|nr:hypothetical protein [Acinetobacter celticus]ODA12910.1 hypothetical protein BBP83_10215 [Acinetobacter celticus]
MHYQYHCACCNKAVASTDKECNQCGSHNIRSPYGFWIFCVTVCLAAAIMFKVVHVYLQDHQEIPMQQSLFDVLQQDSKNPK